MKLKMREKGITLIALVVTIIILLILAGITINLALGENGLITRSKLAKEEYDKEALKEEIMLAKVDKEMELSRELNEGEMMDLLDQYGDFITEDDGTVKFKPNGSSYEIPYEEMKDELGVESSSKIVTITFDSNGGNGNMNKMHTTAGESIKLSENVFTKEHADFVRWNIDQTGSGTSYNNGDTITVDDDITLYAMWANYGTKIEDNYEHIYTNYSSQVDEFDGQTASENTGNNGGKLVALIEKHFDNDNKIRIESGSNGNAEHNSFCIVKAGENSFTINRETKNEWILIEPRCGGSTKGWQMGNLKISFDDSEALTIEDAVNEGFIEPLVLYDSGISNNCINLLSGEFTTEANYGETHILLKITNKANLKKCQFETNIDWNAIRDGFRICLFPGLQLSTTPF